MGVDGQRDLAVPVALTDQQYDQYRTTRGQTAKSLLDELVNTDEFAENRTIRYDGVDYTGPEGLGVAVVLNGDRKRTRQRVADDYSEGLYRRTEIAHLAKADLGEGVTYKFRGQADRMDEAFGELLSALLLALVPTLLEKPAL